MGRTLVRALLVPLSLVSLMACEPGASSPASSSEGPAPTLTGEAPPGSYVYEDLGLQVVLELDGSEGSLEVANGTGSKLGPPVPYVLAGDDGQRIPIDVTDATPIDDGATATFEVSIPDEVEIGMAVLAFGEDEFGAMVPVETA